MLSEPIFGFIHMYGLMIAIGVLAAFGILERFGKSLEYPGNGFHLNASITFLGRLIGGTICFLIGYAIFKKRLPEILSRLLQAAPCGITVALGLGKIGCFFAGCFNSQPVAVTIPVDTADYYRNCICNCCIQKEEGK